MSESPFIEAFDVPEPPAHINHEHRAFPSGSVPAPLNALIGRESELAALRRLLARDEVRLVTLTGPGGVGKTRVALALAAGVNETQPGSVAFIPLAPISDAALVVPAIADYLAIQESDLLPGDALIARLRDRQLLLVLDNFEQLMAAAPLVSEFLLACPGLKVLTTSRRRLGLSGEHEFPVPPLAVAASPRATLEDLASVPAIRLFVARASSRAQFRADRGQWTPGARDLPTPGWVAAGYRTGSATHAAPLASGVVIAAIAPLAVADRWPQ